MSDIKPAGALFQKTIYLLHRIEDSLLAVILLAMIVLATAQIFLRNLFDIGLVWADPLLRIMLLWLGLIGAIAASRDRKHIKIDVLTRLLSGKVRLVSRALTCLFTVVVTATIAYHAARFVVMEYESNSIAVLDIPAWLLESIIPVAFALIATRYLLHFFHYSFLLVRQDKTK